MAKVARSILHRAGQDASTLVLVHGIRQNAEGLSPFADLIGDADPNIEIRRFDYDWTRHLETSASALADELATIPPAREVSIVGYSMGGLVSRLAALQGRHQRLRTVVTVATPNRGAISTAQLIPLGQDLSTAVRWISPLFRVPGVMDLTRAAEIMRKSRALPGTQEAVARCRYASIPALYFHPQRHFRDSRTGMGGLARALEFAGPILKMDRPHDGIVTEGSNRITGRGSTNWSELDYARYDNGASPSLAHAVHADAMDRDHMSILMSPAVAKLVVDLVRTPDWRKLPPSPDVRLSFD